MTQEQYSKATDINVEMNVIHELQGVIGNATAGKYLCTIKNAKFNPTTGILEDCEFMNYGKLPNHIMEKFKKVLNEELKRLEREFAEL